MSGDEVKTGFSRQNWWLPFVLGGAILFLYSQVLLGLINTWQTDENYSHGLLVPFLIGFIVYLEFNELKKIAVKPHFLGGISLILLALFALLGGTLGAELFTQRVSLVVMLGGIVVYFFGFRWLKKLVVPLALLLLAIPIPSIIFNKIAFPLQMLATQVAVWGVRLFEIPVVRQGNVIEILPKGATQVIQMEVVEACSGIRSLMTLVTLALVYAYFTSVNGVSSVSGKKNRQTPRMQQTLRTLILMLAAIPIAVLTNGFRVTTTVLAAYNYGKEASEGFLHILSGWLVYVAALGLLFLVGIVLDFFRVRSPKSKAQSPQDDAPTHRHADAPKESQESLEESSKFKVESSFFILHPSSFILLTVLIFGGLIVNYFEYRGEVEVSRQKLSELPAQLGEWKKFGNDVKFSAETESVLRADDYVMRDYALPDGKSVNLYIGYYASQKKGSTYHSPLNCLPGSGWQMSEPAKIEIKTPSGKTFTANRYIVQNDKYRALMIYWYQGRGRAVANEYFDKISTVYDSILLRRSDGAMIRVMTTATNDEAKTLETAKDFSSKLSESLPAFVPN